jgi:hypothetical protein
MTMLTCKGKRSDGTPCELPLPTTISLEPESVQSQITAITIGCPICGTMHRFAHTGVSKGAAAPPVPPPPAPLHPALAAAARAAVVPSMQGGRRPAPPSSGGRAVTIRESGHATIGTPKPPGAAPPAPALPVPQSTQTLQPPAPAPLPTAARSVAGPVPGRAVVSAEHPQAPALPQPPK